jgi:hypothetical protein
MINNMKFITIEHVKGELTIPLDRLDYVSCYLGAYLFSINWTDFALSEEQYHKLLKQLDNIESPLKDEKDAIDKFRKLTPEQLNKNNIVMDSKDIVGALEDFLGDPVFCLCSEDGITLKSIIGYSFKTIDELKGYKLNINDHDLIHKAGGAVILRMEE